MSTSSKSSGFFCIFEQDRIIPTYSNQLLSRNSLLITSLLVVAVELPRCWRILALADVASATAPTLRRSLNPVTFAPLAGAPTGFAPDRERHGPGAPDKHLPLPARLNLRPNLRFEPPTLLSSYIGSQKCGWPSCHSGAFEAALRGTARQKGA